MPPTWTHPALVPQLKKKYPQLVAQSGLTLPGKRLLGKETKEFLDRRMEGLVRWWAARLLLGALAYLAGTDRVGARAVFTRGAALQR